MLERILEFLSAVPAYYSPVLFAVLQLIGAAIGVYAMFFVGQIFGGTGRLPDIMAAVVWLQAITLILAVVLVVFGQVLPFLQAIALLVAFFWFLWVMVSLVNVAHRLDNLLKSAIVA